MRYRGGKAALAMAGVAVCASTSFGVLSAQASPAPDTTGAAECVAERLPLPGQPGRRVSVGGGDPTGHYIFGKQGMTGPALLWSGGEPIELTGPGGKGNAWITGVNSSGVVVGLTEPLQGYDDTPWMYEDGEYTELSMGNGDKAVASDINENGDVVGTIGDAQPTVWPAGSTDPQALKKGERPPHPTAISDEGVVVGSLPQNHDRQPAYWPDLTSEPQPLALPDGARASSPGDIAGDWVVGYSQEIDYDFKGVRWNLANGEYEVLPTDLDAVNSVGDAGSYEGKDAVIYRADGETVELPAPDDGDLEQWIEAVFEPGAEYTAAGTYSKDGITRPVVWTCSGLSSRG